MYEIWVDGKRVLARLSKDEAFDEARRLGEDAEIRGEVDEDSSRFVETDPASFMKIEPPSPR